MADLTREASDAVGVADAVSWLGTYGHKPAGMVSKQSCIRRTHWADLAIPPGMTVIQCDTDILDGVTITIEDDGELLIL